MRKLIMKAPAALLLFSLGLLCSCGGAADGQTGPEPFSVGFWCWGQIFADPSPSIRTPDSMYALAGSIHPIDRPNTKAHWGVTSQFTSKLPPAAQYWMVLRDEAQAVPDHSVMDDLVENIWDLWGAARLHHLPMVGVQLDVDSPTSQLPAYADFLAALRKRLPPGCQLSITTLLDWFRSDTAIADVIRQTDEFVPQFYDIAPTELAYRQSAIAARFDGARWGPVFNRFGKRFRIGISTFGRARSIPADDRRYAFVPGHPARIGLLFYSDLTPLDLAADRAFQLTASRNQAQELVLRYRATRATKAGNGEVRAGDSIEFIVATPEAVSANVAAARKIGGQCAGIVFFRWPERSESLVLQPDEAMTAAGLQSPQPQPPPAIVQVDGNCAAVKCAGIYLVNIQAWAPQAAHYRIRAAGELEYFLPEWDSIVRPSGPSDLDVTVPPYAGRGRIYLGRAVSRRKLEFTVEAGS